MRAEFFKIFKPLDVIGIESRDDLLDHGVAVSVFLAY